MVMNKLTILCFFLSMLHVLASPLLTRDIWKRDVWNPPITSPNAKTVWKVGQTVTVTWDTATIPPDSQLTQPNGMVVLGFMTKDSENLMLDKPLAKGFKLRAGKVSFEVPSVPTRDNYIVVVFGNSGNASPEFKIEGTALPSSSSSTLITDPIPITGSTITGGVSPTPSTTGSAPASGGTSGSLTAPPLPSSSSSTSLSLPASASSPSVTQQNAAMQVDFVKGPTFAVVALVALLTLFTT